MKDVCITGFQMISEILYFKAITLKGLKLYEKRFVFKLITLEYDDGS